MSFTTASRVLVYNNSNQLSNVKIVKIENTNSTISQTVDITAYGFTNIISVSIQCEHNMSNASQAVFGIIKSYTNTSIVYSVAKSKTTGVLIGGSVEGLELTTGILNHITIIGT